MQSAPDLTPLQRTPEVVNLMHPRLIMRCKVLEFALGLFIKHNT
jgi:hypothetical protein